MATAPFERQTMITAIVRNIPARMTISHIRAIRLTHPVGCTEQSFWGAHPVLAKGQKRPFEASASLLRFRQSRRYVFTGGLIETIIPHRGPRMSLANGTLNAFGTDGSRNHFRPICNRSS